MRDQYQDAWNHLGRINRRGVFAFFASLAALGLPACPLLVKATPEVAKLVAILSMIIFIVCWMVLVISYFSVIVFPCPRCRKQFYKWFISGGLLKKACRNCGLKAGRDKSGWSLRVQK
jgi:hypothetical protein